MAMRTIRDAKEGAGLLSFQRSSASSYRYSVYQFVLLIVNFHLDSNEHNLLVTQEHF